MDIIKELEDRQIRKITEKRAVPDFAPGDTLLVKVRVSEGERTRLQSFEGVCIGRSNDGLNSSFTVRKISYGEGVERVFPLHSPAIAEIEVVRRGNVRRAKLYYLRGRAGKKARITEKTDFLADGAAADKAKAVAEKAKKKKKHDIEVPVTGEAPPENLEDLVAEAAAAATEEEKQAKKEKKKARKAEAAADKADKKPDKKADKKADKRDAKK